MMKPRVAWLGMVAALLLSGPTVRGDLIWLDDWQVTASGDSSWSDNSQPSYDLVSIGASAFARLVEGEDGYYEQYDGSIEIYRPFVIRNAPAGGEVVSLEFFGTGSALRTPAGMGSYIDISVDLAGIESRSGYYSDTRDWGFTGWWTVVFEEGQQGYIRASLDAEAFATEYAGGAATAWADGWLELWISPAGVPVPEPSGLLLLSLGLAGLAVARTRLIRRV